MKLIRKFSGFLKKFFRIKKSNTRVRRVIIGLRLKFIFLLSIILLLSCFLFMVSIYVIQHSLISRERIEKIRNLTQLLEGVASEYLYYADSKVSKEKIMEREAFVSNEIYKFKELNPDVVSIFMFDENGRLRVSYPSYLKKFIGYVKKDMDKRITNLVSKNFREKLEDKKTKKVSYRHYKIIICPVILRSGDLVFVNEDFDRIVNEIHKKGLNESKRTSYLRYLFDRYSHIYTNTNQSFYPYSINEVFLDLYKVLFIRQGKYKEIKEKYLFEKDWIKNLSREIEKAISENNLIKAKNIDEKIYINMLKVRDYAESFLYLGTLNVVFDLDSIRREVNNNQKFLVLLTLVIFVISFLLTFFAVGHNLKNLKLLESWAVRVGEGNLSYRINIKENDEIGRLSDVFQLMLDELIKKYQLEKFVSISTRSMISSRKEVEVGRVDRKDLAFIFTDIRGFTSFSEKNSPEVVINVLNEYFERQVKIIHKFSGDIDDFVGDQIMAHFSGERRVDRAIKCAIEIMNDIYSFNEERKKENLAVFEIGIGLNAGNVVVGNIGAESRMDFACIGDTVNTASRLCSIANALEIIAPESMIRLARMNVDFEEVQPVVIKGKEKPINVVKIKWR